MRRESRFLHPKAKAVLKRCTHKADRSVTRDIRDRVRHGDIDGIEAVTQTHERKGADAWDWD